MNPTETLCICDVCHTHYDVFDDLREVVGRRCWMEDEERDGWFNEPCKGTVRAVPLVDEVVREYRQLMSSEVFDPERVHDQCHRYSQDFISFLEGYSGDGLGAELVYGFQLTEFMGKPVIGNAHVAVRIGERVYDWTYRQFDPEAPVPRITTVEEFRTEWQLLA